jgi:hypothetical protein
MRRDVRVILSDPSTRKELLDRATKGVIAVGRDGTHAVETPPTNGATKMKCAKCPTCGQEMPKVEGWKVNAKGLAWSHRDDGTLTWYFEGDEGASIGECGGKGRAHVFGQLMSAMLAYLADRCEENREQVDTYAFEVAALDLVPTLASEEVRPGKPIPWKRGAKAALVHRASLLAAEAVKTLQEEAK